MDVAEWAQQRDLLHSFGSRADGDAAADIGDDLWTVLVDIAATDAAVHPWHLLRPLVAACLSFDYRALAAEDAARLAAWDAVEENRQRTEDPPAIRSLRRSAGEAGSDQCEACIETVLEFDECVSNERYCFLHSAGLRRRSAVTNFHPAAAAPSRRPMQGPVHAPAPVRDPR